MQAQKRLSPATIFPLIVVGYVLIQVFAAYKAYVGLGLRPYAVPIVAVWILLMTFSLPILWRLEHHGRHRLATVIAWVGFSWMGWVFLFFWIALGIDIVRLIVSGIGALSGFEAKPIVAVLGSFYLQGGLALAAAAYGFVDARNVRIEHVRISSTKLRAGGAPFRLALISDVHLGTLVGARRLRLIIDRLRAIDADIVVSVGDLVDGLEDRLRELAPMFRSLQPRYGKFAVTGNHEYYAGIQHSLEFHKQAGFEVLRARSVDITESISIAGVDDPTGRTPYADERVALGRVSSDRFAILLKHQPVLTSVSAPSFDLQLSGHVHRGQIFPFGLLVRLVYPVRTGLTRVTERAWIYVSRGTGTWGPPMRVGSPPEITLIELHAAV